LAHRHNLGLISVPTVRKRSVSNTVLTVRKRSVSNNNNYNNNTIGLEGVITGLDALAIVPLLASLQGLIYDPRSRLVVTKINIYKWHLKFLSS